MAAHTCHAEGCPKPVPRRLLMCARHWRMVPKELQSAVWAAYRPGQERRLERVTREYLDASKAAIDAVAAKEGRHQRQLDLDPKEPHQ